MLRHACATEPRIASNCHLIVTIPAVCAGICVHICVCGGGGEAREGCCVCMCHDDVCVVVAASLDSQRH